MKKRTKEKEIDAARREWVKSRLLEFVDPAVGRPSSDEALCRKHDISGPTLRDARAEQEWQSELDGLILLYDKQRSELEQRMTGVTNLALAVGLDMWKMTKKIVKSMDPAEMSVRDKIAFVRASVTVFDKLVDGAQKSAPTIESHERVMKFFIQKLIKALQERPEYADRPVVEIVEEIRSEVFQEVIDVDALVLAADNEGSEAGENENSEQ